MLLPHLYSDKIEAGCDEAGRGCLAGSVYAAAVILPADYNNPDLNDSKLLSEKQRYALRLQIEHDALAWAVGVATPDEIDKINILHASFLAMHRAIDRLRIRPEVLIIDGNRFDPYFPPLGDTSSEKQLMDGYNSRTMSSGRIFPALPHTCVIKGDGKYQAIAAAAILAKTYRDDYMNRLAKEYPFYDWEHNKGYPTRKHREGILQHGISPFHRKSYRLTDSRQHRKTVSGHSTRPTPTDDSILFEIATK